MSQLRSTLDFLLYDWLHAETLNGRDRYAEHSRDTFDAVPQETAAKQTSIMVNKRFISFCSSDNSRYL